MRTLIAYLKASFAFMKAFVAPLDLNVTYSENGHAELPQWDECPEEGLLALAGPMAPLPARAALYGYSGKHQGEVIFLSVGLETLGVASQHAHVLTPNGMSGAFRCYTNGTIKLVAEAGSSIRLNGVEEPEATLLDFDDITLLGNGFLVLDLPDEQGGAR